MLRTLDDGTELVVQEPARDEVVDRVVAWLPELRAAAVGLLTLYLRPEFRAEVFRLDTVEVLAERSAEGGDAELSFSYSPDEDPEAEGYTRFDVVIRIGLDPREEPFRAVRLAVGFH